MNPDPVAPNLFATVPALRLIGGRHRQSGRIVFPLPGNPDYEPIDLPDRGLLWSFTVQRFAPKSPPYRGAEPFRPFAVGYVELADALIVESPLTGAGFETLHVGMPMELTTVDLGDPAKGTSRRSYAFRPAPRSP